MQRLAARAAYAGAFGGILYAIAFVFLSNITAASLLLMIGGLLSTVVLSYLATTLFPVNEPIARWARALGIVAVLMSVAHGGYDLANQIHPPGSAVLADFPNPVDPRGLATFGITGLAFLTLTTLAVRSERYPRSLARLGQALGIIMIVIYLGRLIILDPANLIVRIALAAGVIANTAFLVWLARVWSRGAD